jgi:6-pyruvoyltetrahydropterin/6-carboxytetrahydropterin synthase
MMQDISEEEDDKTLSERAGLRTLQIGHDNPVRISAGHRILHHDGKCSYPHGHNYHITVQVTGNLSEEGWIVDKGKITTVIDEWDHRFLVEDGDPLIEAFEASGDSEALVILPYPPTAEVMSMLLEERMLEAFPDAISDVSVSVRETEELCATY